MHQKKRRAEGSTGGVREEDPRRRVTETREGMKRPDFPGHGLMSSLAETEPQDERTPASSRYRPDLEYDGP